MQKTSRPDITIDRQTGRTFTADRQAGCADREGDRTIRKSGKRMCIYTGRHNIQINRKTGRILYI